MKKFLIGICIMMSIALTSCTMADKAGWKNMTSSFKGGTAREITVSNAITGEVYWSYRGECYIDDGSTPGDIIIYYYENKDTIKRVDFLGQHIVVGAIEI